MKKLLQLSLLDQPTTNSPFIPHLPGLILAAVFVASLGAAPVSVPAQDVVPASTLLDISGVDWIENDLFVAVHDGNNNAAEQGRPRVSLLLLPADVAQQDGFKIEGVALRPRGDGTIEVYAGTDDENYGAVLRQVAPIP